MISLYDESVAGRFQVVAAPKPRCTGDPRITNNAAKILIPPHLEEWQQHHSLAKD